MAEITIKPWSVRKLQPYQPATVIKMIVERDWEWLLISLHHYQYYNIIILSMLHDRFMINDNGWSCLMVDTTDYHKPISTFISQQSSPILNHYSERNMYQLIINIDND